jgi:hypothetical protein
MTGENRCGGGRGSHPPSAEHPSNLPALVLGGSCEGRGECRAERVYLLQAGDKEVREAPSFTGSRKSQESTEASIYQQEK